MSIRVVFLALSKTGFVSHTTSSVDISLTSFVFVIVTPVVVTTVGTSDEEVFKSALKKLIPCQI